MFTGIIEEIGRVRFLNKAGESARMSVEAKAILDDIHMGDSISVSGACLTVVAFDANTFTVDISPETLGATTIGELRPGDPVNLERAMQAGGRFGGHMVSGHVDGVGALLRKTEQGNAQVLTFSAPKEILEVSVPKGSMAVDGVSLTVNEIGEDSFSVAVIPHTVRMTTLGARGIGSRVNLEADLIGKHIQRLLSRRMDDAKQTGKTIDMGFLSEHGFV